MKPTETVRGIGCLESKFPLVSLQFLGVRKEGQPLWEILSSITTYNIWKAQCSFVFHQVRSSPTGLINNIWLDMFHTLKGQGIVLWKILMI